MSVMSTTVMHKIRASLLFAGTLAAPIAPHINARQFPERGPADTPGSGPPAYPNFQGGRQNGVLYPRPPRQAPQPGPPQGTPPFNGAAPDGISSVVASPIPSAEPVPPLQTSQSMAANSVPPSPINSAPSSVPVAGFDPTTAAGQPGTTISTTPLAGTVSTTLSESIIDSTLTSTTAETASTAPMGSLLSTTSGVVSVSTVTSSFLTLTSALQQSVSSNSAISLATTISTQSTIPADSTALVSAGSTSLFSSVSVPVPTSLSTSFTAPPASPSAGSPSGSLSISLVNNLASNAAHAYISGLDPVTGQAVMLTASGEFYYLEDPNSKEPVPITADIAHPLPPQGQSLQITIPTFIESARVWFADGALEFSAVSSPNGAALREPSVAEKRDNSSNTNWGFVELSHEEGKGLFANLSFVDFVGMALGMELQTSSSGTQIVPGMPADAVQQVCDRLRQYRGNAAKYWASLCVRSTDGSPLRVISPAILLSQQGDAFPSFFQRYVDKVWDHYTTNTLTIDSQNTIGNIDCRVEGDEMKCDGDNRGYSKPNGVDILGCNSGPFAIQAGDNAVHLAVVPRLCAAFNRATFLLPGGDVQPALPTSAYYSERPHNVYSQAVHAVEKEGHGYAFSYDDVTPSLAENVAGNVSAGDPQLLTVYVGGML